MPFGLTTAPATFQCLMNNVFGGLEFVVIYLDDILVCSKNWSEHLEHLRIVFEKLREAGLKMKPSKCRFGALETIFLGHILTPSGLRMDADKLRAMNEVPIPKSLKALQRFLGLTNYYRKFIFMYGPTAAPLYDLLGKSEKEFEMNPTAIQAFEKLKELMKRDVLLRFPDFEAADGERLFTY